MNTAFDARGFRDAVGRFVTGVTIVTTRAGDGAPIGMTANSFSSVSLDPPLILFSLDRRATSRAAFESFGYFAINILAQEQQGLSARFARPGQEKWQDIAFETWETGCPILRGVLAALECRTEATVDGGDHLVFLGRVQRLEARRRGRPLLFNRGAYHALGERLGVAGDLSTQGVPPGDDGNLAGLEPWIFA